MYVLYVLYVLYVCVCVSRTAVRDRIRRAEAAATQEAERMKFVVSQPDLT